MRQFLGSVVLLAAAITALGAQPANDRLIVADRVDRLTRESRWRPVASIPIAFTTHHPQGMVKIGNALFVSSVEIQARTKPFAQPVDGFDRDAGQGVGHLFKIDLQGNLITDLKLGDGTIYHPGGIDYDGRFIWVPVAEYRPNSRSIVYRVDPETMTATEVFRFRDHIGGVVHDTDDNTLHGVSWGSRRFYRWTMDRWWEGYRRRYAAGEAAVAQHFALSRLPGLQVRGPASHAVHRRHRNAPVSRSHTISTWRARAREPDRRPAPAPGPGAAVDLQRSGHDAQPGLDRA